MKVLLISHTCMSRTAGQPKLHSLASHSDISLDVLVPDKMAAYGEWRYVESPESASFRFHVRKSRCHSFRGQWYLMHYAEPLGKLLQEIDPDVVDIWQEPWSAVCAQMVWLTRRYCPRARIIVETEQNIYKKLPPPFQQFQNYSLRHTDYLIARNNEAIEVIRKKGYQGPVSVVGNAVDCELFQPLPEEERAAVRQSLVWGKPTDFLAGYVGRLVPEKGLAEAVKSLTLLPESTRLIFVGSGPMRAELEEMAQKLGVGERVVFTGAKPLTELPQAMNAMDVLLLPSRTTPGWKEQFGRVLIEAGACAVAVIGSSSGAIPEVIGEAGLVFPEGEVPALAQCIQQLTEDSTLRKRCGEKGLEQARNRYSWDCVASQMRRVYEEVLGSKNENSATRTQSSQAFTGRESV